MAIWALGRSKYGNLAPILIWADQELCGVHYFSATLTWQHCERRTELGESQEQQFISDKSRIHVCDCLFFLKIVAHIDRDVPCPVEIVNHSSALHIATSMLRSDSAKYLYAVRYSVYLDHGFLYFICTRVLLSIKLWTRWGHRDSHRE